MSKQTTRVRIPLWPALVLLMVSATPPAARADPAESERPPELKASALLPPELLKSPYHTVREAVAWNGHLFRFEIESQFGLYTAGSRRLLEIRVREIRTMAGLVAKGGGHAFFDALGGRLVQVPTSLVKAAVNPIGTLKAVPKFATKTFGRVKRVFDRKPGAKRNLSPDELRRSLVGAEKRRLAKELQVDPYSSNAKLQQLLDEVATERYAGGLTISLASYAIPGGAASALYSVSSYRTTIVDTIADKTVDELREHNAAELRKLGVHRYLAGHFLSSKVLSPTVQTASVAALSALNGVRGRDAILEAALTAEDEAMAVFQLGQAAALAVQHRKREKLTQLHAVGGAIVATTASGTALVLAPVDGAFWSEDSRRVLAAIRASAPMRVARKRVLYVKGRASERFRAEAKALGLVVAGWPERPVATSPK